VYTQSKNRPLKLEDLNVINADVLKSTIKRLDDYLATIKDLLNQIYSTSSDCGVTTSDDIKEELVQNEIVPVEARETGKKLIKLSQVKKTYTKSSSTSSSKHYLESESEKKKQKREKTLKG
jgi:hypothetical protein